MSNKVSMPHKTKKIALLLLVGMVFVFALVFSGCASQNAQQSSQTVEDASDQDGESSFSMKFGDVSKEFLEEFDKCYSEAKNMQSNTLYDYLMYMYRVIDVEGPNYSLKISAKLSGEVGKEDEILLDTHPTQLNIFLDGQPAKLADIKPGYLLNFYGKDMGINLNAWINPTTGESIDSPLTPVTFISAWTANQN